MGELQGVRRAAPDAGRRGSPRRGAAGPWADSGADEGGEEGTAAAAEEEHATGCGHEAPEPTGTACFFPTVDHAEFEWSKAVLSLAIAAAGLLVGRARLRRPLHPAQPPSRRAHRALAGDPRPGYLFLANKYYLDWPCTRT